MVDPAAHQRAHRPDQEHLGRRRLLRRRARSRRRRYIANDRRQRRRSRSCSPSPSSTSSSPSPLGRRRGRRREEGRGAAMSTTVLYDAPGPKARRTSRIISVIGVVLVAGARRLIVVYLLGRAAHQRERYRARPGVLDPRRWDILGDLALWRAIGRGLAGHPPGRRRRGRAGASSSACCSRSPARRDPPGCRVPATVVLEFFRGMPVLLMMLFILLVFSTGAFWAVRRGPGRLQRRAHRRGAARGHRRAAAGAARGGARHRPDARCGRGSPSSSRRPSARCCRSSSPSSSCC